MLEQKLFFTRNGNYTFWEKITLNEKENLYKIKYDLEEKFDVDLGDKEQFIINNIYKLYSGKEQEDRIIIEQIVDENFSCDDRSDFNALLYKFDNVCIDINTVNEKIKRLDEIVKMYDNEDILDVEKYVYINDNIVDIRLSSRKTVLYKGSSNEQILNTEIRIYIKLGLIVMTDFSDYTHKKTIKKQIISDISNILTGSRYKVKECILTDMTLRVLLKQSKNNASKYKFSVEGLMDVDFNIVDGSSGDPLNYDHIKTFYEKYSLSLIRISMSENSEKYITIDGDKAKLNSRSKNLEPKDIDEFMECLNEVMKYDYLNKDYRNQVFETTKFKLIMPTISKRAEIDDIYIKMHETISLELVGYFNIDIISIINNAFFYCLLNNRVVREISDNKFTIDGSLLKKINKLFELGIESIEKLYSDIIFTAKNNKDEVLESIDRYIMYEGVENVS